MSPGIPDWRERQRMERQRRRNRRRYMHGFATTVIALVVVSLIVAVPVATILSRHTETITVEDKERGSGRGEHKTATLVFAEDETYKVSDSILALHWSSSDVYRKLKRGETYECEVQGFRIPLFSMYKNIIGCDF